MIKKLLLFTTLSLTFIACGGDGLFDGFGDKTTKFEVISTEDCTLEGKNQFVYDVLKDSYYWSDKVGELNISLSTNEHTFLDNFLYQEAGVKEQDLYSYVISQEVYNKHFISGKSKGFGYRSVSVSYDNNVSENIISFVFPNSPADKAGIKRSDIIVASANNATLLQMKDRDGLERNITLQPKSYEVNNVLYQNIYSNAQKNVGYFLLQSFIGPNLIDNLNEVFSYFKSNDISDLILDLRYNGGGLLHVSAYLGSLIGGENVKGHIFQYNKYNEKYSKYNDKTYFSAIPSQSLHLKRVFILTTAGTASASESLINALKASDNNMEVVTIGMDTYGKQFGMHTMPYCDRVLVPIQFSDSNSDGIGFVDGLKPTCKLQENFAHDFTDTQESLLSEALFYIENGHCKL